MPTPTDSCPNAIHGDIIAARPRDLESAFRKLMTEVTEEVMTQSLRRESRLAEFNRNPDHITVVHVSVTIIDQDASKRAYTDIYDQHGERMVRVLRFALHAFEHFRRLLMARSN